MKYTALAVGLLGVAIACYGGHEYATGDPPDRPEQPSPASLLVPLAGAVGLVAVGAAMWAFGGKGYTVSGLRPFSRTAGGPKGR